MNRTLTAALLVALCTPVTRADEPYVWKNVAIYGGGFITGIVTHPKEAGLIYCRTDIGGAYRWNAKAKEWIPLNDWVSSREGNLLGIESLAIDPNDPSRLYLAAGTYTDNAKAVTSILRSSDRGKTFQRSDVPIPMGGNDGGRPVGERLAVDPTNSNILFFGSRDKGLWTSTDAAATWTKVESFPAIATDPSTHMQVGGGRSAGGWSWPIGISFVQFDSKNHTIYVAVCTKQTSLYRSTDAGKTWHEVPNQPVGLRPNHAAVSSDSHLYISYGDEPGPHEMNDGALWKLNTTTGDWSNITPVKPTEGDRFGYSGISIDASDPNILVTCTFCRWTKKDQIFRSTDAGKTWTGLLHTEPDSKPLADFDHTTSPFTQSLNPHWIGDVEIDPFDPNRILFVTGYGLWVSTDAAKAKPGEPTHWKFEDKGIEEVAVLDLLSPPQGAHLVSLIGDFDGFRHDDLDLPPKRGRHAPNMGTNHSGDFAELAPAIMVRAGNGKPHACFSTDGGATWSGFATVPNNLADRGNIAISADGASIVFSSHFSTDRGATWHASSGLPLRAFVYSDRADANTFYALAKGDGNLYLSTDSGASFSPRAANLPDSEHRKLRPVPGRKGDLWLCADNHGLLRSTDSGSTFTKLENVADAQAIGFGKPAPGSAYPAAYLVGTINNTHGVYRSTDEGKSWTRINDDAHQYAWIGQSITGDPRIFGRVYLATNGRGIIYGEPHASK